jgi:hypothetical protein
MESDEKKISSFITTPLITLVLVIGFVLWIFLIIVCKMPVWGDEYFTFKVSSFPIPETIKAVLSDAHPPLYWILTNLIQSVFPGDILPLRIFSALCGVLAIFFTCLIIRNIRDDSQSVFDTQMIFLAIALTSPFTILFFSMARYYALFALLVSISLFMKTSPVKTIVKTWGIIVIDTLMLYTNFLAGVVLVSSYFVLISARTNRPSSVKSLMIFFIPWILFLPIVPALLGIFAKINAQDLFTADFGNGIKSVLTRLVYSFHVFMSGEFIYPWQLSGIIMFLTGIYLVNTSRREKSRFVPFFFFGVFLPLLYIVWASVNKFSLGMEFLPSRIAFTQLGILLAIAIGLSRISSLQLKSVLLLIIMIGNLHANYKMIHRENFLHSTYIIPWQEIADDIEKQADPNTDIILYDDSAFEYELIHKSSFPQSYNVADQSFNLDEMIRYHPGSRIWFVFSRRDLTPEKKIQSYLDTLENSGYRDSQHFNYVEESDSAIKMKERFLGREVEKYKKEMILFQPD